MRRSLATATIAASYVEAGDHASAIRLVCIHGAAHCGDVFGPLFARPSLASMHRVGVDLPGRYGSSARARSAADDASFVRELIASLRPTQRTIVLGHSYGGAVALELALAGGLDALVLVSTGARLRVRPDILDAYERAARGETAAPRRLGFSPEVDPAIVSTLEMAFDAVPPGASFEDWSAANAFDRMKELETIGAQALILAGDDDPFTPMKYGEFLASKIPNAALVRITRGSHMAVVEDAARIADAIAGFARAALTSP